jgi:undecaprenyl-diphosphatase
MMIEFLNEADTWLFLVLNGLNNDFFDFLMYWISYKYTWVPLYAFFLFLLFRKYKLKALWIMLFVALLITFSDQFSVMCKNHFERLRPCHNEELDFLVHTVKDKCGGRFGFISGHATNSFALAVFLIPFLKSYYRFFPLLLIVWASVVAYSRVYLGVHYPGDILAGAFVGSAAGYVFARVYFLIFKMATLGK